MSGDPDLGYTKAAFNGLTKAIPYLLAGLEGAIEGFDLHSISLQRVSDTDYRCILRGFDRGDTGDSVRLVSFTNAGTVTECILHAEHGFRSAKGRWIVDQYAKSASDNGSSKSKAASRSIVKGHSF